jgi:uncharacterized protein
MTEAISRDPKPFAVVTGASSGIGYELANQFAQHGFDLLIIAEDDGISEAARRLSTNGTIAQSLKADLASGEGVDAAYERIRSSGRTLDAIALNAGVGVSGPFSDTDLNDHINLINLNIMSPVCLTHKVLKDMIRSGRGRILFTSSIAATMPGPFLSTYSASKAFLKSFAQAIRNEVKDSRITVTTLMPGETDTNFFERAGMEDTKLGAKEKDDPADVARQGFDALMEGKDHVVAGAFKNKVQATLSHVLPDTVGAEMHRKQTEPGSARK